MFKAPKIIQKNKDERIPECILKARLYCLKEPVTYTNRFGCFTPNAGMYFRVIAN